MRYELLTAVALALACASLRGDVTVAAKGGLAFEEASVRPSAADAQNRGVTAPVGGYVRAFGATVTQMILYAYNIDPMLRHDPEPIGGPAWIDDELFDIVARGPSNLSFADARQMMMTLLRERFQLRSRLEAGERQTYALVIARPNGRLGPQLRRSRIDCSSYSATLARTGQVAAAKAVAPQCGLAAGGAAAVAATLRLPNSHPRGTRLIRGTATLAELVAALVRSPDIDRRIVDRTNLRGTFDIELTSVPSRSGTVIPAPSLVVSIFTAVQEQLGLKLEPRRESLDVVVIDAVTHPTPD